MAAKSSQESRTDDQRIKVWLSENEETDDEYDHFRNSINRAVGHSKRRSNKKDTKNKPEAIPPWKRSDSVVDLLEIKLAAEEELESRGCDSETETEEVFETNSWTHNFKMFTSKPLCFTGTSGPTITSNDPFTIFTSIWDRKIMSLMVEETNRYARQTVKLQENLKMPECHECIEWEDTTIEELYTMFALIIFASYRASEKYLFGSKKLTMPVFSEIMRFERFAALNRFLHFVDNEKLGDTDMMLAKMKPVFDHCNERFSSLYRPRQFLDVDDSFLLSKEDTECSLRLQANNLGLRTYELTEVFTGYVLKVLQYSGSDKNFTSKDKAQIVLDLVQDYSNKGHRVVTNKYFSSVYLARRLRSKGFDSIGEVRKSRKDLPEIFQKLEDTDDTELYTLKGNKVRLVTRHCGDVSVMAWSEWDMTALSTYHTSEMRANKRGIRRPGVTLDLYKVKEKILNKDEDLREYIMIRQPSERWYIRQFKSLFNISLRNMFILHKYNSPNNQSLDQVGFRQKLANQLLDNFGERELVEKARAMSTINNSDDVEFLFSDLDNDDSADCSIM